MVKRGRNGKARRGKDQQSTAALPPAPPPPLLSPAQILRHSGRFSKRGSARGPLRPTVRNAAQGKKLNLDPHGSSVSSPHKNINDVVDDLNDEEEELSHLNPRISTIERSTIAINHTEIGE